MALSLGAVLVVAGSVAPWVSTLGITANTWDLRDIAGRLGYGGNRAFEVASTLWAAMPISFAAAVALAWFRFRLISSVFAVLGSLYAGIVAIVVLRAPDIAVFSIEWGVWATLAGSVVALAAVAGQIYIRISGDRRGS